jgi:poly(beta-D-mannuronate) lyase
MRPSVISQILLILTACAPFVQAERLRSPWDNLKITQTDAPYNCPAPPPFTTTLDLHPYYIDNAASIVDQQKLTTFQKNSEAPTHLGQFTTQATDAYLSKGSREAARCVYSLLEAAAKANAFIDKMPDFNGVYLQNWLLSGTAIAFLKVRNSGLATPLEDAVIRRWFRLLSIRVREYFDAEAGRRGVGGENNHLYWAGLAVAAEGIIDDNPQATQWGANAYFNGISSIRSDGSLPQEMARAGLALHYHLYALGPLIMIAEILEANGAPAYAANDHALSRLVNLCVAGLEDPAVFEKRVGVAQVPQKPLAGLVIGWAGPYVHRFPNPKLSALLAQAEWISFWQWGGAPPE